MFMDHIPYLNNNTPMVYSNNDDEFLFIWKQYIKFK